MRQLAASLSGSALSDNATQVALGYWGVSSLEAGFGEVLLQEPAYAGHYYQMNSSFYLETHYTWSQAYPGCGSLCGYYYDPFDYDSILSNPQTVDIQNGRRSYLHPLLLRPRLWPAKQSA